jgi:hypothetical protein
VSFLARSLALAAAALALPLAGAEAARALPPAPPVVLLAAGDVAGCNTTGDEATAAIIDGFPSALVAMLGDAVYPNGTTGDFESCYAPSWGRFKARTRPAVGNHEYRQPGAAPYFAYFGSVAGPPDKGWYSYDYGAWHVVVLNSNCGFVGGCGEGSAQEQWLRSDLAASSADCTLAYMHHPRFSSGRSPQLEEYEPLWTALWENGADVVLAGHDHIYERQAPQTPIGDANAAYGIREFIAGTGGFSHSGIAGVLPRSEVRNNTTFGVLKLDLSDAGYSWTFLPEFGAPFTDSGSGTCHDAPPDVVRPSVTLDNPAPGSTIRGFQPIQVTASDNNSVARVDFLVDSNVIGSDSTPPYGLDWNSGTYPDGVRPLRVRAVDATGNSRTTTPQTILIDNQLPETTITSAPAVATRALTATFVFDSEPGATFTCTFDGKLVKACASTLRLTSLRPGKHSVTAQARDAAGNLDPTPASFKWTIDRTAPSTRIDLGRMQLGLPGTAFFRLGASEQVAFQCSLDFAPYTACVSPVSVKKLAPGKHTFRVRSTDPAGNADFTPATRTWTVSAKPTVRGVYLTGGPNRDVLVGTSYADVIVGGAGNDTILGKAGNDALNGETGNDRVDGGAGNDRVTGGEGRDTLLGGFGRGRDTLLARDGFADALAGGGGRDSARVDRRLDHLQTVEVRLR